VGSAVTVSQYVSAFRHQRSPDQLQIQALTEKLKADPLGRTLEKWKSGKLGKRETSRKRNPD